MNTDLSRRRFLEPVLGTTILLLIPGCGGGDGGSASLADSAAALGATPNVTPSATAGTQSVSTASAGCGSVFDFNHGHLLTILRSDLDFATAKSYDIQGGADHTHTVTFSVAQLATLKSGASVTITSTTTDYHQHGITVSCV